MKYSQKSQPSLRPGSRLDTGPPAGEKVFTVFVLLLATGGFMNLLGESRPNIDPGSGMVVMQVIWSAIYLLMFGLLIRRCKGFLQVLSKEWLLILLVGLAVISVFWSDAPAVTFRRSVALIGTCLFGVYLAKRYQLREQLKLLGWVCGIVVVSSLIFGLLKIGTPVEQDVEGWFGIFVHKNVLGRMMVLSTAVFFVLAKSTSRHRWAAWSGVALSTALILLSNSKTSLLVFLALLGFLPLDRILRRRYDHAIAALCLWGVAVTGAAIWAFSHFETIAEGLGRDPTLTGRLFIWVVSIVMALQEPWLGYGYSAFWLGAEGPSFRVWLALGWATPHAHNGFLDLWLELGMLGVALFLVGFAVYTRRAVRLLQSTHEPEAIWPLVFLGFMLLSNLTESSILRTNSLFWIVYVAVAYRISSEHPIAACRLHIATLNKRASWSPNKQTNPIFDQAAPARMKGHRYKPQRGLSGTMRILAWPAFDTGELNPYTRILYRQLGPHGVQVEDFRAWRALWTSYDIFHLHWPEYYVANRNPIKAAIGTIGLLFLVYWCRMRGAKVVWTAHNLGSHNERRPQMERWFWKVFTTFVDAYICLTESSRKQVQQVFPALKHLTGFVIPHGHYRGEYPNTVSSAEARECLGIPAGAKVLLFFGTVAQYKNVPALIKTFRQLPGGEKILLIAGACVTSEGPEPLRRETEVDPRIKLHVGFVPREKVQLYFQAADLVVLPFREILNSGSALLALSFNRPILVPAKGAMPELQQLVGESWIRTYPAELTSRELSNALEWASCVRRKKQAPLSALDWEALSRLTLEAYSEVIGGRAMRCS